MSVLVGLGGDRQGVPAIMSRACADLGIDPGRPRTAGAACSGSPTTNAVKALVVTISSPGGTTYGGEVIYKAIRKVAAKKPVVSDIRTLAASAGYMIALAGDTIIAGESSITGSIGVIFQYPQVKDADGQARRLAGIDQVARR